MLCDHILKKQIIFLFKVNFRSNYINEKSRGGGEGEYFHSELTNTARELNKLEVSNGFLFAGFSVDA